MTDAPGDTALSLLTTLHAVEARGGDVEAPGPGCAFRAARPGPGVVTAAAGGAWPGEGTWREEDFAAAAEAACAAGADFHGPVPGQGWTAMTPGDGACVVLPFARDFPSRLLRPLTPPRTSAAPWGDAGAKGAGWLQEAGRAPFRALGHLAPAFRALGADVRVPSLPPGAPWCADVFALAVGWLKDRVAQASGRPPPPAGPRRGWEALSRVGDAARGFPQGGRVLPTLGALVPVIACPHANAAALAAQAGGASPAGAGAVPALAVRVDVARGVRGLVAHAVFLSSQAHVGGRP